MSIITVTTQVSEKNTRTVNTQDTITQKVTWSSEMQMIVMDIYSRI